MQRISRVLAKKAVAIVLVGTLISLFAASFSPPVHATSYSYTSVNNTVTHGVSSFNFNYNLNPSTHLGDELITMLFYTDRGGAAVTVSAITDNLATHINWKQTATLTFNMGNGTIGYMSYIYGTLNSSAAVSMTSTITWSGQISKAVIQTGFISGILIPFATSTNAYVDSQVSTVAGSITLAGQGGSSLVAPTTSVVTLFGLMANCEGTTGNACTVSGGSTTSVPSCPGNVGIVPPLAPAGADEETFTGGHDSFRYCNGTVFESASTTVSLAGNPTETWTANAGVQIQIIVFSYAIVFALPSSALSSTQTQTIGSCPPGGGTGVGHFTLANNTQYWYSGNALGSEVVNTIQTEVSSTIGSGSHTLQLLIYVTASNINAQAPSVNFPATLAYSKSFTITSGTTNSTITLQVSVPLNTAAIAPLPFNYWAVGIVGDDHIKISGSTLSGLVTQTGAASIASQPLTFTGPGSSSTNKLALCATGNYQSILAAVTTTTTAAASTTTTSTVTSTINTIGPALFTTSSNWPVIFLILLLPAGLFLGATKTLAGAILGLIVGAVIGQFMGILPPFVFIGLVISLIAIAFIARERSQ